MQDTPVQDRGKRRSLRRIGWLAGGGLAVLLASGAVFAGLTADMRDDEDDPDALYRTRMVERGELRETVVASGVMEPLVRVPVISEVSGIISAVHVEEGDRVQRGQPLFELDRERLEARVAERRAELQLRQARARYDLIGRAEAELAQTGREHARIAELRERDVLASHELETAEHKLRLAEIFPNLLINI